MAGEPGPLGSCMFGEPWPLDSCDAGEAGQFDSWEGGLFPCLGLDMPRDMVAGEFVVLEEECPSDELDEGEDEEDCGGGGARGTGKLV